MKDERIPRNFLMENFIIQDQWENQEEDGGRRLEGHYTDPRDERMEETSRRQRGMEASAAGGQGPEGAALDMATHEWTEVFYKHPR
jgi:hypothetical protein